MSAEQYNRMAERMRQRPMALRMLLACNQGMTWLVMIAYPLLLLYLLFLKRYEMLYHTVLIPGVAFVVVSVFRRIYNAPRPYEKMDITPLIAKDKQGQRFPSRHVFSAFMIGMCFLQVSGILAGIIFAVGVFLSVVRVLGGVHFLQDVIAGAVLGIAIGIVGFYIIF